MWIFFSDLSPMYPLPHPYNWESRYQNPYLWCSEIILNIWNRRLKKPITDTLLYIPFWHCFFPKNVLVKATNDSMNISSLLGAVQLPSGRERKVMLFKREESFTIYLENKCLPWKVKLLVRDINNNINTKVTDKVLLLVLSEKGDGKDSCRAISTKLVPTQPL